MSKTEVLKNAIDSFTEEPKTLKITIHPDGFINKLLVFLRLKKTVHTLNISPITLRTRAAYSKYTLDIESYEQSDMSMITADLLTSKKGMHNLVMAIATAIHNKKSKPPKWLIDTVYEFSEAELTAYVGILRKSLNAESFLNSIILMKGMSLQAGEIIAPEPNVKTSGK